MQLDHLPLEVGAELGPGYFTLAEILTICPAFLAKIALVAPPHARDWVGDILVEGQRSRLLPEIDQRDANGLLLRRSNSVLAVEVLVTASPEWWVEATPAQRQEWQRTTLDWLAEAWGGRQNLAHMRMHGDETTPHLTGYVVPLDERGALNCRSFIGERQQLRQPGS